MINERFYLKKDDDNVYMDTFIVDDPLGKDRKRPIIVICPGGGLRRGYTYLPDRYIPYAEALSDSVEGSV